MLNYIGSKWSLLPMIRDYLKRKNLHGQGIFCDLFAGTTAVGQMAKRMGFSVISNDWQAYSYALGQAYIAACAYPTFDLLAARHPYIFASLDESANYQAGLPRPFTPSPEAQVREPLRAVLVWLDSLPPVSDGFVYTQYCLGGTIDSGEPRQYYSDANGQKCDAIRRQIEQWWDEGLLTETEYYILIVALLEAIDRVANTASVYAAFLKHLKATARRPMQLGLPNLISGPNDGHARQHEVYKEDANQLVREIRCDVLYIDPPYNHRQYASNYHMLETIVTYDNPAIYGKTGLRPHRDQKSRYCSRKDVYDAFEDLIANVNARHILISYNDEGLLRSEDIMRALKIHGEPEQKLIPYRRFRADRDREGDANTPRRVYAANSNVNEYLFYVRNEKAIRAAS